MPHPLTVIACVLLLLSAVAFWPVYLSRWPTAGAYTHAHAALGSTWLLLLAVQPMLLRARRRQAHRWLGRVGIGLGVAFVVSSLALAGHSLRRMPADLFAHEGRFVYLPLAMALLFALTLALAVQWRHVPAAHGRFMACTTLPLLDPLFARLLFTHGPVLPAPWLYQLPAFTTFGIVLALVWRRWPAGQPGRDAWAGFGFAAAAVLAGFFIVPDLTAWQALVTRWRGL